MSTIADIASFVTDDVLKRSDLTTAAQNAALAFYKVLCANVPFDQLMYTSAELPCTANQDSYDLAALITSPAIKAIRDVRLTVDSSNKRRLRRSDTRVYDAQSLNPASIPATYARWNTSIELRPPPQSSSYTIRVRFWAKPTINVVPANTVLETPEEWDELMRYETLYRVYNFIGQSQMGMMLIQPAMIPRQPSPRRQRMLEVGIIPRLWNELLSTVSAKEGTDEDFGINPVVRSYSFR